MSIMLIVIDIICLIVAAIYVVKTSAKLPTIFPGHDAFVRGRDADSAHHHIALGIAAFMIGTAALVAAAFADGPRNSLRLTLRDA